MTGPPDFPDLPGGATRLAVPTLASVGIVRRRLTPVVLTPGLSGISDVAHIALTYDDGPDPVSTPHFLELLARFQVRATFFVIGKHVGDGGLLREMCAQGHEIGIHGWDHTPTVLRSRHRLGDEIARTRGLVESLTSSPVHWYRPPYGWLTRRTVAGATAAGLRLVLWSAWGRDWRRAATADSIEATVLRQVRPGGTVLLHDSDRVSSPRSWTDTLTATYRLLERWSSEALPVGPLGDHWSSGPA
ncbi:MAG TPA: polysaccharide deacetylase family protein [Nocardioides sp.]|nr:polysaccharide deacetylase family protein [Nocardioides sp.]